MKNPLIIMGFMLRQNYAQLSIFNGLDDEMISQLSPFFVECMLPKDHLIFEQGQPAEHFYVLLEGEVEVDYKPYDGPLLPVARIEPGGVFGWSAAIGRDVYTSGAVALQDSTAYRLHSSSLSQICALHPDTGKIWLDRLASVIAVRLRSTHAHVLEILSQGKTIGYNCKNKDTHHERK